MSKSYHHHYNNRRQQSDPLGNFFKILFAPLVNIFNPQPKIDYQLIKKRWADIREKLSENSESSHKMAVIEADKLLDSILKNKGAKGENFGERLRDFREKFRKGYSDIWQAHIIRNKIVHESEYSLSKSEAENAIRKFKKGLEILRVLK